MKMPQCKSAGQISCETLKISAIIWVFKGIWVICAKPPFLNILDVPIKMFTNTLAVLNQQKLGRITMFIIFKNS